MHLSQLQQGRKPDGEVVKAVLRAESLGLRFLGGGCGAMTIDEAIDGLSFAKKWQHRDANMPPTPPHPPQTMVLELHVWGPAFGLPSIDSECIAAVAYAQLTLREGTWVVVASHDVDKSPNSACVSGVAPYASRSRASLLTLA